MDDQKEWRGKVDEELSDLKAATKTLTSVVDTLVNRIASFERKLDDVGSGPNIAQWSGWGVGIGGLLWILITGQITGIENGAKADREWLRGRVIMVEDYLEHDQREGIVHAREAGKREAEIDAFQYWMEKHVDGMWDEIVKMRNELNIRTGRLARLDAFVERQHESNERQQNRLDDLDRSASIDKDELERDAFTELRDRIERLEEGVRRNFFKREQP